jgi:dihydroneopterin aldolase
VIRVELQGLEIYGFHGVYEEERRDGQLFLFDVELEVGDAALSDAIADTVDYSEVAGLVKRISDGQPLKLLEALAATVADAVIDEFPAANTVRVRVRKPAVRIEGFAVEFAAAAVERRR